SAPAWSGHTLRYEFGLKWGVDIVTPAWCHDTADAGGRLDTRRYKLPLDVSGRLSPMEQALVIPALSEEDLYMDGCRILLSGLVGDRGRLYVNIARAGGATIPATMDGRVTHVVVATMPSEEQLAEWRQVAPVVHAEAAVTTVFPMNRQMNFPKRFCASTVRPRWSRAVADSALVLR
ncbi:MAG: hypothetical protein ACPGR8_14050, partial [Limisphaerales bacterium]